jgi:FMN reductase
VTRVVVLTAGLSQPSSTRLLADRLAAGVQAAAGSRGAVVVLEVVELRELARDLTNQLLTGFASGALAGVQERVQRADALVVVTPIFSASYSGLFKMFFDVLPPGSLVGKPTLIAATAGTARHSLALEHALRPLFAYLRAVVVPTAVFAATEDWADGGALDERVARAAGELVELLRPASSPVRPAPDPLDEPDAVVPFARLLARGRG